MMEFSQRKLMWYDNFVFMCSSLMLLLLLLLLLFLAVGLWRDLLGGVYWREDPLPRSSPYGTLSTT
jgi:hypothetical protein